MLIRVNGTGMDLLWILLFHQVVKRAYWVGRFLTLASDWSLSFAGVGPKVGVVLVPFHFYVRGKYINSAHHSDDIMDSYLVGVSIPVCLIPSAQETWAFQPSCSSFSHLMGYRRSTSGLYSRVGSGSVAFNNDSMMSSGVAHPTPDGLNIPASE